MRGKEIQFDDVTINPQRIRAKIQGLSQIIYEISQSCNLRCIYCTNGGKYYHNRSSSSKSINFTLAKTGLDYIYNFIKDRKNKEFSIGFYGGEPLLKFEVIKKIVIYSSTLFKQWRLRFNITTNGTLLNDRIIDFLIDNRFDVTISLDGPKENHDAKRVFHDGKGTFQMIMDKLAIIKKKDDTFYTNNISFFAVHSNDLSLKKLYHFFKKNELVNKNSLRFGRVNYLDTNYYECYPYNREKKKRQFDIIFNYIVEKLKKGESLFPIETALFQDIPILIEKLKVKRATLLMGSCCFDNRLFIDAEGRFHICNKMNDKFPFGDVNSGLDFEKMAKIVRDFTDLIKKHCLNCEAKFLCQRCYIHFAKNGVFAVDPMFCENSKKVFSRMEKLVELKEKKVI